MFMLRSSWALQVFWLDQLFYGIHAAMASAIFVVSKDNRHESKTEFAIPKWQQILERCGDRKGLSQSHCTMAWNDQNIRFFFEKISLLGNHSSQWYWKCIAARHICVRRRGNFKAFEHLSYELLSWTTKYPDTAPASREAIVRQFQVILYIYIRSEDYSG